MKSYILFLFLQAFSPAFAQDRYTYLPPPNEKKVSEIDYIYENGNFWQNEKYVYNAENNIDRIETRNPFKLLISTRKYEYDKENRIILITKLNNFHYPIGKKVYEYFPEKYVVKSYNDWEMIKDIETYDLQNRMIEHTTFKDGETSYRYVYKYIYASPKDYDYYRYTPENELEEKQTIKFDKVGNEISENTLYEYNLDNQVTKQTIFESKNKIISQTVFEYHKNKKVKSRISTGENNEYSDKKTYEYDEKNRLIKETFYGSEISVAKPKFDSEVQYFYDENSNLIEVHYFNNYTGKKLIGSKEFYDLERRLIKKIEYYFGKKSIEAIYEKGLEKLETKYNDSGNISSIAKFDYDENGNVLMVTVTDANNILKEKFGYKYDEKGKKTMIEF